MDAIADFGEVDHVSVTVLVDNRADMIVRSTETVKYFTDEALLAEHGYAALIDLVGTGQRFLWDAGGTPIALMENARRMGVDLTSVDAIALSHGHWDHFAAVADVLAVMERSPVSREWTAETTLEDVDAWVRSRRVPLVVHPAALRERWRIDKEGKWSGPETPPPTAIWEALGAEIICAARPYQLAPGCWTTGYVPRRSFEHSGRSKHAYYREGDALVHDDIEDDQALILNVKEKGLVVVAGCAHAGIVNTVRYAQEITGIDQVYAVVGGFHLARAEADELERTIAAFKGWNPALISPSHCTGFGPICRFATEMPQAFVPGVVGITYRF